MNDFELYFRLGASHIADLQAYDHIVFLAALSSVFLLSEWQRVLWLVTAFTVGHSITLALSVFKIIVFPTELIEVLIPITILITSLTNAFDTLKNKTSSHYTNYFTTLFFGFIHGCGFSNYLNTILMNASDSIWQQLLAFNIGLEIGQFLIVAAILIVSFLVVTMFHVEHTRWKLFMAGVTTGISLVLISHSF